jgi:hypothetical protein
LEINIREQLSIRKLKYGDVQWPAWNAAAISGAQGEKFVLAIVISSGPLLRSTA